MAWITGDNHGEDYTFMGAPAGKGSYLYSIEKGRERLSGIIVVR